MSYLGLPAAAFRPWSPSKGGPGGGYPPFPPCFAGTVPFPPHRTASQHQQPPGGHHHLSMKSERGLSPVLADPYRRAASSPPLIAVAPPIKMKHVQEKGLFTSFLALCRFCLFVCPFFWVSNLLNPSEKCLPRAFLVVGPSIFRILFCVCAGVADGGRFPTLADEISTIKEALDGAPVHAKEAVLKILERLTQRVDRAERDRDLAVGRYRELQARYDQLEEELAKKRAELRELLRQESSGGGGVRYRERELMVKREMERISSGAAAADLDEAVVVEANMGPEERGSDREVDRLSERSGGSVSRLENYSLASGLPKIELKSPARVLQEEAVSGGGTEQGRAGRSSSSASRVEPDKAKANGAQVRGGFQSDPSKQCCGFRSGLIRNFLLDPVLEYHFRMQLFLNN